MLSDSIRVFRELPGHDPWMRLTLHLFEVEARSMENRIATMSGRPHVALTGRLMVDAVTPPPNAGKVKR